MSDPRTVFPDNIYHTLTSTNEQDEPQKLRFASDNGNDIVSNPMMYYLLIEKFVLPNSAFPIMLFDNTTNKYFYKREPGNAELEIEARAVDYRGDLLNTDQLPVNGYYRKLPIYFVQQFIDMMNASFQRNAIVSDYLLSLQDDYRFRIDSTEPYLEFSSALMAFFPTLESRYIKESRTYQIILREDPNNPGTYSAVQEFKSLYALSDIRSILLLSSNLPISSQGFTSNNTATRREKVLNEFIPILDENSGIDRSPWIFESNEYRPIDMISQEGFANYEFDVRLIRKSGEVVDYFLLSGETANVTFRFSKRALFNNEYNIASQTNRIKQNPSIQYHKRY